MPRTARFVERQLETQHTKDCLLPGTREKAANDSKRGLGRKVVFIRSMGGIGKTQLAAAFATRHHSSYSAVLWLDGSSVNQLERLFVNVAKRIAAEELGDDPARVLAAGALNPDLFARGVLQWLSLPTNKDWLMIIDNVDWDCSPRINDTLAYDIKTYLSGAHHGSIIITSRLAGMARRFVAKLKVPPLSEENVAVSFKKR